MSTQSIKMPDIGEGIAEVELVAWHVQVGDTVAEDQILADVMTDKATVEIPSHVTGIVLSLDAAVGQVVAVGTEIIHIEVAGSVDTGLPEPETPATKNPVIANEVKQSMTSGLHGLPRYARSDESPVQVPGALSTSTSTQTSATATAPAHAVMARNDSDAAIHVPLHVEASAVTKPVAAPAVRRRAWELGIDLASVKGTGPAGRITQADLDAHTKHSNANSITSISRATAQGSTSTGSADPGKTINDPRYAQRTAEEAIPVIGLRRKIAQKMQDAKRRIPHFTYVEEIDVTELEDLRARLNTQYGAIRGRLTLLPFLIRAIVLAVRQHPEINARYDDEAAVVTRFAAVHLGLATQTSGGLMVPVIRHAETLDLWACAAEILRLAQAARSGRAAREELSGSTITVTSLGPLAGIAHTPVINHPEVAIVGPNRIVERPMLKNGLVVARKMMNLSSSFDHRVVDGMNAAEFIQQVRAYLECPGTLLLD
ncbi:dihydrolipoamide acetyltransferase family protein [Rhodoferax sp.]|uniref:dihydrolipoamide acetyltransferase family protein n=1 Tax=Rhodoferax sp. TaxID=50421 RepID=UPI0019EE475A|nr:dihydrolipoamide acetyltransferase family protein [Rhodoferax sp.]MBE0474164.1 2-oxo acid dehydrogenase subunit E2 [Rhodoferax sp.]